tara:strand:+ start:55 stop:252 length:198 start_codon:yes stop_codon:yes gene_type:complete
MKTSQQQFQDEIEAFLTGFGFSPTVFGRDALGDPGFVFQIRAGRSPHLRTIDKVRAFMEKQEKTE